jgi:hypothetical protein
MPDRIKIPALALLGLSLTDCTGREPADDPIVGDWRAIQIDGEKQPQSYTPYADVTFTVGQQLRIDPDLAGEMVAYQNAEEDGLQYDYEYLSDLAVEAQGGGKYRVEVARDVGMNGDYTDPGYPDTGRPDTGGYDDGTTGDDSGGYDSGGYDSGAPETGGYAIPIADGRVPLRPLAQPSAPNLAPAELVLQCTLDGDTLTCDQSGADAPKHWVFTRITDDEA